MPGAHPGGAVPHPGAFLITLLKQIQRRAFGDSGGTAIMPWERWGTKE
jgi:hypothetical protein